MRYFKRVMACNAQLLLLLLLLLLPGMLCVLYGNISSGKLTNFAMTQKRQIQFIA
jgi:hypothetical protein